MGGQYPLNIQQMHIREIVTTMLLTHCARKSEAHFTITSWRLLIRVGGRRRHSHLTYGLSDRILEDHQNRVGRSFVTLSVHSSPWQLSMIGKVTWIFQMWIGNPQQGKASSRLCRLNSICDVRGNGAAQDNNIVTTGRLFSRLRQLTTRHEYIKLWDPSAEYPSHVRLTWASTI